MGWSTSIWSPGWWARASATCAGMSWATWAPADRKSGSTRSPVTPSRTASAARSKRVGPTNSTYASRTRAAPSAAARSASSRSNGARHRGSRLPCAKRIRRVVQCGGWGLSSESMTEPLYQLPGMPPDSPDSRGATVRKTVALALFPHLHVPPTTLYSTTCGGGIAKWLRRRSAKPLFPGSNPGAASNLDLSGRNGWAGTAGGRPLQPGFGRQLVAARSIHTTLAPRSRSSSRRIDLWQRDSSSQ